MGGSFLSRLLVTATFLLLSLFLWESYLAWLRYVPAGPRMAAFERRDGWVVPLEPGTEDGLRLPRERFRGARFDVLTPSWPLSMFAGEAPRARLVGLYVAGQGSELALVPWSGGRDPLAGGLAQQGAGLQVSVPGHGPQLIEIERALLGPHHSYQEVLGHVGSGDV